MGLFFPQDADDDQQVACEAEHGGNDDSAGSEDVGIERLRRASWAGHQDVASCYQHTGHNQDAATGRDATGGVVRVVHIDGCIVGKYRFFQIVRLR